MKKRLFLIPLLAMAFAGHAQGEEFLTAPVVPQAEVIDKTKARLDVKTPLSHQEVLEFYREQLKDQPDIKFRDWKDATYIEDDGKLPWHSITISKEGQNGTSVVILKDNWTWIIGTLLLRFVGGSLKRANHPVSLGEMQKSLDPGLGSRLFSPT